MKNSKSTSCLIITLLALLTTVPSARAISFVQWSSGSGGNDHYYGITDLASNWSTAEATGVSLGGNLVSITSAAEQSFLASTFLTGSFSTLPLWIGLTDIPNGAGSRNYTNWTTGEAVVYTNWNTGTGEPNNAPPGEDYGAINWHSSLGGPIGTWNDTPLNGTVGYGGNTDGPYFGIVELTQLPGVPDGGSTAMLLSVSLAGLGWFRRKTLAD